jgi:hypothetical protein
MQITSAAGVSLRGDSAQPVTGGRGVLRRGAGVGGGGGRMWRLPAMNRAGKKKRRLEV